MTISVCPIVTIHAPLERVWGFLSDLANYALWWDAQTRSLTPEGHAQAGQKIYARTKALGKWWDVNILVEMVDDTKHQLQLKTMLPLGITVHNHITCAPLDSENSRVTFG